MSQPRKRTSLLLFDLIVHTEANLDKKFEITLNLHCGIRYQQIKHIKLHVSQIQWPRHMTLTLRRPRQKDGDFKTNVDYI